jgi:hypothetical protein
LSVEDVDRLADGTRRVVFAMAGLLDVDVLVA